MKNEKDSRNGYPFFVSRSSEPSVAEKPMSILVSNTKKYFNFGKIFALIFFLLTGVPGFGQGYTYSVGSKGIDELGKVLTSLPTIPHIYLLAKNDDDNQMHVIQIDKKTGKILWSKYFLGENGEKIFIYDIKMLNDTTICAVGEMKFQPYLETFNFKGEIKSRHTFNGIDSKSYINSFSVLNNNLLLIPITHPNGANSVIKYNYITRKIINSKEFHDDIILSARNYDDDYYILTQSKKTKEISINNYSSDLNFVSIISFNNLSSYNKIFKKYPSDLASFEISPNGDKATIVFTYQKKGGYVKSSRSAIFNLKDGKILFESALYFFYESKFINDSIAILYGRGMTKFGADAVFRIVTCTNSAITKTEFQDNIFTCKPAFEKKIGNKSSFCPEDDRFWGFWYDGQDSSYYFSGHTRAMGNYDDADILIVKADKNLNIGTFSEDYSNYLSDLRKNIVREYRQQMATAIAVGVAGGIATSPMGIYNITGGNLALTQSITNSADQLVAVIDKNHDYSQQYNMHKTAANSEMNLVQNIDAQKNGTVVSSNGVVGWESAKNTYPKPGSKGLLQKLSNDCLNDMEYQKFLEEMKKGKPQCISCGHCAYSRVAECLLEKGAYLEKFPTVAGTPSKKQLEDTIAKYVAFAFDMGKDYKLSPSHRYGRECLNCHGSGVDFCSHLTDGDQMVKCGCNGGNVDVPCGDCEKVVNASAVSMAKQKCSKTFKNPGHFGIGTKTCPICNGNGVYNPNIGTCTICSGTGKATCTKCHGMGRVK